MQPKPQRKKPGPSLFLHEIKGITQALAEAKAASYKVRIDMWFAPVHTLCGFKVRTMTVLDYVLLEHSNALIGKPLEPTIEQVARFLWLLSPEMQWWEKHPRTSRHFPSLRQWSNFKHSVKVMDTFGENMPESSEPIVLAIYDYMALMFEDQPAYCSKGKESKSVYLASWFDRIRNQYACSLEECWSMPIPQLFQSLKAINSRLYPEVPQAENSEAKTMAKVLNALNNGATYDDLRNGRITFDEN